MQKVTRGRKQKRRGNLKYNSSHRGPGRLHDITATASQEAGNPTAHSLEGMLSLRDGYPQCHNRWCRRRLVFPTVYRRCQHMVCAVCAQTREADRAWCHTCLALANDDVFLPGTNRVYTNGYVEAIRELLASVDPDQYKEALENLIKQHPETYARVRVRSLATITEEHLKPATSLHAAEALEERKQAVRRYTRCCGCCIPFYVIKDTLYFFWRLMATVTWEILSLSLVIFLIGLFMLIAEYIKPGVPKAIGHILEDNASLVIVFLYAVAIAYIGNRALKWMRHRHKKQTESLKQRYLTRIRQRQPDARREE